MYVCISFIYKIDIVSCSIHVYINGVKVVFITLIESRLRLNLED